MSVRIFNTPQERLRILGDDEIDTLYGRPRFTHEERIQYFALSPTEEAALVPLHSVKSQVCFILQLGYFKGKYSVSPSMSESALLVIAAGYVLCRPGLAGPSPSARVRPRTPPDNEWRDGGRVACAGAPAFTTSGCLLHRTAAVRRCRHLPGIIRCGLRTCMAGRARRRVRDTEGRIVYKLAHGGDYKYAPDH